MHWQPTPCSSVLCFLRDDVNDLERKIALALDEVSVRDPSQLSDGTIVAQKVILPFDAMRRGISPVLSVLGIEKRVANNTHVSSVMSVISASI